MDEPTNEPKTEQTNEQTYRGEVVSVDGRTICYGEVVSVDGKNTLIGSPFWTIHWSSDKPPASNEGAYYTTTVKYTLTY